MCFIRFHIKSVIFRLEEREAELKKDNQRLHERITELLRANVELSDRLKCTSATSTYPNIASQSIANRSGLRFQPLIRRGPTSNSLGVCLI
ncbi:unnamed protein product [Protopolystoma xenopodis]|uniref:Uncharacterized protein n=1 Tax=Protopolystoma xenopodis TaxID=117903 RepID=A0A3S5AFK5_9PLAT|nr:unnamed protein product [Protopolystoma xenopodis]